MPYFDDDDCFAINAMLMLPTRKRFRFAVIILFILLMVLNRNNYLGFNGANAVSSDFNPHAQLSCSTLDPESVALCLKEKGMESIYHRLSDNGTVDDCWKVALFARLDRIQLACGTLCQLNTQDAIRGFTEHNPKGTLPLVRVPDVDCVALFELEDVDVGASVARKIPVELYDYFTIGGSYEREETGLRHDVYLGGNAATSVWTKEGVESDIYLLSKGELPGTYGKMHTNSVRDKLVAFNLTNKSVLVIGSQKPWLEAICLYAGARHVTTLEYGKIVSRHPQISTMTPDEFRSRHKETLVQKHLAVVNRESGVTWTNTVLFYDGMVSYSSLEHSGLGRYGDALNPWGDILAVARAWCVTKDDSSSFMFLGVPTGKDMIFSNWHRVYGEIRWPLLAANWRHVEHTDYSELQQVEGVASYGGGLMYHFEKVVRG